MKTHIEPVIEDDIFLYELYESSEDAENNPYQCVCYDGYAICSAYDSDNKVELVYPKLAEVLANEELEEEVREYRGIPYTEKIHFGDIMLRYGKIKE